MKTQELQTRLNNYYTIFSQLINNVECTVYESPVTVAEWIQSVLDVLSRLKAEKKRIFIIGNGASCSMASHFAVDFTKNAGINSFSINEGALMTCFSNDFSYETAYQEMLKCYMTNRDLLFAISSSGKSQNIVKAADYVRSINTESPVITLSGFSKDNPLRKIGTYNLYIDANEYGFIESAHSFYMHMIIDMFLKEHE